MKKLFLFIMIGMLVLSTVPLSFSAEEASTVKVQKILFIYAPGFSPYIPEINKTNTLKKILENATIINVVDAAPYDPLYSELVIVNNTWDLSKALPENDKVILANGSEIPPYKAIPPEIIKDIWGATDTVFIAVDAVDPTVSNKTANPYYDTERNVIPPQLLTIPLNGSIHWDILNTDISVSKVKGGYRLVIKNYIDILIGNASMISSTIKLDVKDQNLPISTGTYWIRFRIVDVNETHVVLFTPGTRKSIGWISSELGELPRPVIPTLPIQYFKYLGEDDIEWVINEVTSFYSALVEKMTVDTQPSVYFIYYPLLMQIHQLKDNPHYSRYLELVLKGLSQVISMAQSRLTADTLVMIYSPFSYTDNGRRIDIDGLELVLPGLYKITGDLGKVIDEVTKYTTKISVITFRDQKYLVVNEPDLAFNGAEPYGPSYLVIFNPFGGLEKPVTLTPLNIASYLVALARGYSYGLAPITSYVDKLREEINNMTSEIKDLKNKIKDLNSTIDTLKLQLGEYKAKYINMTSQISDLKKKIEEAQQKEQQALLFATVGTISIIVIVVILSFIVKSMATKTVATRRKK